MDYRTLHAKTVADLRLLAKQNGVKLPVGANKMRIVELILQKEQMNAETASVEKETKAEKTDIDTMPETAPKRRGRPSKKAVAEKTEEASENPQPKRRGRPPKIKTPEIPAEEGKEKENTEAAGKPGNEETPETDKEIIKKEAEKETEREALKETEKQTPAVPVPPVYSKPVQTGENTYQRYVRKTAAIGSRRELYGENGMGTSNAAVAEMLHNNECMDGAGVLEMHPEGYGFLRAENYLPGTNDVYVSIAQIRRFGLRNGDYVVGKTRPQREGDRYTGLVFINTVNGEKPDRIFRRPRFEDLTPVYPNKRIRLETADGENDLALRSVDLIAPVGKGQRGMIVSPPKAGKTVLIKKIANAITKNHPEIHLIVLLIDERPEEVTDIKRSIQGEVVYSTFDETPENHTRLSEMTLDRAQRLVEMGKDVVILMDSITRLARAYNLVIPPTGRSLSGGLDPGALHKPKRFFGAARNIENGGSLTIIATALVETGSRMDDIIYEEFKGTGNMELHLDRKLSERRIFPAIDLNKSGTRRDELILTEKEAECALNIRRMLSGSSNQDTAEQLIGLMEKTKDNDAFCARIKGWMNVWQKEGYSLNP